MGKRLTGYAENLLIALIVFIAFLILFESRMSIPPWLQVVGRMHPLMLHFPIVILMLALSFEYFRFRKQYISNDFYRTIANRLLLGGLFLAALTVIMGLLLAKEDGYKGDTLNWHKWTGVSTVFIGSAIYLFRKRTWYRTKLARAAAIATMLLIIITGHFGAVLTHGEDFITAPLSAGKALPTVALEDAKVFDDLIKPVFESKCVSCHNPEKMKGQLDLSDSISIAKGGKSGKLFIAGHPELSLLITRIHLPEADKKRMPPKGKAQLSDNEMLLLSQWIRSNAAFNKKVVEFNPADTLRVLAAAMLKQETVAVVYDFDAADEKLIAKLNHDYRLIAPVAKNSPALDVSIYNRSVYSPATLSELEPLKVQIVSLALAKLPVSNSDLKSIAAFSNLRTLNLNFTDITGEGLKSLSGLKKLETLSLSGTRLSAADLQTLKSFPALKTLALWDSGLGAAEMGQLKKSMPAVRIIDGFHDEGKDTLKLNLPQLENKVMVFSDSLKVELSHPIRNAELRYTSTGNAPDSAAAAVYNGKLFVNVNTRFKVRAFKAGWKGSDTAVFSFYKCAFRPDSIGLLTETHETNRANGVNTLFDSQVGNSSNYYSDKWLGFSKQPMEVIMKFTKPAMISNVSFNTFYGPSYAAFGPSSIEIWEGESPSRMRLVHTEKILFNEKQPREVKLIECKLRPTVFRYMKLVLRPFLQIPKRENLVGIVLVDEVLLN